MRSLATGLISAALCFSQAWAVPPPFIAAGNSPPPTDTAFINQILQKVNGIRARYSALPLQWKAELAEVTLRKSNGCKLDHSGPYGENAYLWYTIPFNRTADFPAQINSAFDAWISPQEIRAYLARDYYGGGHFTQTVWKASTHIGCAFSTIQCLNNLNKEWWFYCDFEPAGNILGLYPQNVGPGPGL
ncbi:hypothetical protein OQA88_2889 [Cercophora sp. LCS_1]